MKNQFIDRIMSDDTVEENDENDENDVNNRKINITILSMLSIQCQRNLNCPKYISPGLSANLFLYHQARNTLKKM